MKTIGYTLIVLGYMSAVISLFAVFVTMSLVAFEFIPLMPPPKFWRLFPQGLMGGVWLIIFGGVSVGIGRLVELIRGG